MMGVEVVNRFFSVLSVDVQAYRGNAVFTDSRRNKTTLTITTLHCNPSKVRYIKFLWMFSLCVKLTKHPSNQYTYTMEVTEMFSTARSWFISAIISGIMSANSEPNCFLKSMFAASSLRTKAREPCCSPWVKKITDICNIHIQTFFKCKHFAICWTTFDIGIIRVLC